MIELPVVKASDKAMKPKAGLDQITISSARRDRCVPQIAASARNFQSKNQHGEETASIELLITWPIEAKHFLPSFCGRSGNDVPAKAAAPKGDLPHSGVVGNPLQKLRAVAAQHILST